MNLVPAYSLAPPAIDELRALLTEYSINRSLSDRILKAVKKTEKLSKTQ